MMLPRAAAEPNAASAAKIKSIGKRNGAGPFLDQATHAATRANGPRSK